jgi:hypothetical protein
VSIGRLPTRVHLVVDTGVDDALALVVAWLHPALDLVGVTASAGNTTIARAWANTLHVLHLLGADTVPVSVGAVRRHDGRPFEVRAVHGPDGLAGLGPPVRPTCVATPLAVHPSATLVCLAPLTTLLQLPPAEVVASYALPGEANEAMDPEAARLVRGRWVVRDAVGSTLVSMPCRVGGTSPLTDLVSGLLAHRVARAAGLGDAEVVLRLAGVADDPGRALCSLLGRADG